LVAQKKRTKRKVHHEHCAATTRPAYPPRTPALLKPSLCAALFVDARPRRKLPWNNYSDVHHNPPKYLKKHDCLQAAQSICFDLRRTQI
jgi:hypothetical protein